MGEVEELWLRGLVGAMKQHIKLELDSRSEYMERDGEVWLVKL